MGRRSRKAVVSVVGRQHSARPQRPDGFGGIDRRGYGHLRGPGDVEAGTSPVIRLSSALLVGGARRQWRTGIAHASTNSSNTPGPDGNEAGRSRTAPNLTSSPGRGGLRDMSSCSMRWRSGNWPTSIPTGRPLRRAGLGRRPTLRCSTSEPNCTASPPWPRSLAGAVRRRDRSSSARRRSVRSGPDAFRCGPNDQLLRRLLGCERPRMRVPRRGLSAPDAARTPPARRRRDRIRGRVILACDARPNVTRADPAGRGGICVHRPRRFYFDPWHGWLIGTGTADTVAATHSGDLLVLLASPARRSPRSKRWIEPGCGAAVPGVGRGARPAARDAAPYLTVDRHLIETVSRAKRHSPHEYRGPTCWSWGAAHDIGKGRGATTVSSAPSWPRRSAPDVGPGRPT